MSVSIKMDACADVCVCVMFQSECAIMGACVFVRKCVCVCVCVNERERERGRIRASSKNSQEVGFAILDVSLHLMLEIAQHSFV